MKLFFLLIILYSSPILAISEQKIITSVLDNFPLIEQSVLKYRAAEGELTAAEGEFDHKLVFKSRNRIEDKYDNSYVETTLQRTTPYYGIGLIAGHRQGRGTFPDYDGKYETSGAGEIFAGLSIPLLRDFGTDLYRTNVEIARIEKDQAKEEVLLKKNIYVHKALSLYYKWLLEKQKIKVKIEMLQMAEKRTKMLERRYRAGDIERLKLSDNQRSIDKRRDDIMKSEIAEARLRMELSIYLQDRDGNITDLSEKSELSETMVKALPAIPMLKISSLPQFKIITLEKKKMQTLKSLHQQSKRPGLNLELLGTKELSPNAAYDPESFQIGVKFDFPLENRKAKGKSVAAEYKVKSIDRQQSYLNTEISRLYDFSKAAMIESNKRWDIVSREYQNTKIMALAEKGKWEQGASDLFVINLREQDVADTEIKRWTSLYEFLQYYLDARLYSASLIENQ